MSMNVVNENGYNIFSLKIGNLYGASGSVSGNLEIGETMNYGGHMSGNYFAFLGKNFANKNNASIQYSSFSYIPNATDGYNYGKFDTHYLIVHEDIAHLFNESQYDLIEVIPHHNHWTEQECGEYLVNFINTHLGDL